MLQIHPHRFSPISFPYMIEHNGQRYCYDYIATFSTLADRRKHAQPIYTCGAQRFRLTHELKFVTNSDELVLDT